MGVKLLFTVLCDDIRLESSGKFVLVGVYNRIIAFQNAQGTAQSGGWAMPKLCLFRRWDLDETDVPVKTEIVGPDSRTVMAFDTRLVRPPENTFHQEIVQLVGVVFSPGHHRIVTTYQDATLRELEESFEIRVVSQV